MTISVLRRSQARRGSETSRGSVRTHRAFTLIELLLVMGIIAVLGFLVTGLLRSARDDAAAARTRSIINRCQAILRTRLELYEARNMPYRNVDIGATTPAQAKLYYDNTIIEWLIVEMPTKPTDLTDPFPAKAPYNANTVYFSALTSRPTAMHQANLDFVTRYPLGVTTPSEFLYMVLYNTWDGDNRGTHFLQSNDIIPRDVGAPPQVLDGFGDPLNFQIVYRPDLNSPAQPLSMQHLTQDISLEQVEIVITSNNVN